MVLVASSTPPTKCVLACGLAPDQAGHVRRAVARDATLLACTPVEARVHLRSSTQPIDVLVVGEAHLLGEPPAAFIRAIAQRFPSLAIVAYCRAGIEHSATIRSLVHAGVHELVFVGRDDAGVALRAVLDSARRDCAATNVLAELTSILPRAVHFFVETSLRSPSSAVSLGALARAVGINRKTLFKTCAANGLPAPSELLMWCRLAMAAYLHARTGRTLESIALELEFPSANSMRNRFKTYTGLRATELRAAGGASAVIERLRRRLAPVSVIASSTLPRVPSIPAPVRSGAAPSSNVAEEIGESSSRTEVR